MIAVQMVDNPFVGVGTLHAELATWDAKFHAQEAAVCPAKWQLRGRFIEEVFAPLLSKVHGRQMALVESAAKGATESAMRQAEIVALYQAQLAKAKQATTMANKIWAACDRAAAENGVELDDSLAMRNSLEEVCAVFLANTGGAESMIQSWCDTWPS